MNSLFLSLIFTLASQYELMSNLLLFQTIGSSPFILIFCLIVIFILVGSNYFYWNINKELKKRLRNETKHISDLNIKKDELRLAKEKAEEADRLKSAFLASISHEIRAPLNSIVGFSDLIANQNLVADKKRKYTDLININIQSLLNFLDNILNLAQLEAGQLKLNKSECHVNKLLMDLFYSYNELKIRKSKTEVELRINKECLLNNLYILTDAFRLQHILSNLLSNAINFTEKGVVEIGFQINETDIVFYVQDTGVGIKQETLDNYLNIQGTFLKKGTEITGLGLPISQKLAEVLGGKLTATSKKNEGSTFFLTLPLEKIQNKTSPASVRTAMRVQYNWEQITILIAEDEVDNYLYLRELLKKTNANILWAKNGKEAVDIFAITPTINLILMDIRMPEMDGYEATEMIKKIRNDIPVIAQTAFAMADDRQRSAEAGIDEHIAKPINAYLLLESINKHLKKALG